MACVPKRDYNPAIMLELVKSIAQGTGRVAFAAGAGACVLLICLMACAVTLVAAPPKLKV